MSIDGCSLNMIWVTPDGYCILNELCKYFILKETCRFYHMLKENMSIAPSILRKFITDTFQSTHEISLCKKILKACDV